MVQYFYVTFMSPAGPGAMFFKGEQHPLHKDQMIKFATNVARRIHQHPRCDSSAGRCREVAFSRRLSVTT